MLAQLNTDTQSMEKDNSAEKLPANLTIAYTAWYASFNNKSEGWYGVSSGSVSGVMSGPSVSLSLGRWSLSGSFLFNNGKFEREQTTQGVTWSGTYENLSSFDRYEADLILRRSYGSGGWLWGPQFGIKYFGIKNYDAEMTYNFSNNSIIKFSGSGEFDAYGPTLGGVLGFIPGNPETSPITISLLVNVAYLNIKGKDPSATLYDNPTNMRNAGVNPNTSYPQGVNIGKVPVAEVNKWVPAANATIQISYNIFKGLNLAAGARYNVASAEQEYIQRNTNSNIDESRYAYAYFEYWGAFANIAYSF